MAREERFADASPNEPLRGRRADGAAFDPSRKEKQISGQNPRDSSAEHNTARRVWWLDTTVENRSRVFATFASSPIHFADVS